MSTQSELKLWIDKEWPEEMRELILKDDEAGAIDWCLAHKMNVPRPLCDAYGAKLTSESKVGRIYKVEPYLGRVRILITRG